MSQEDINFPAIRDVVRNIYVSSTEGTTCASKIDRDTGFLRQRSEDPPAPVLVHLPVTMYRSPPKMGGGSSKKPTQSVLIVDTAVERGTANDSGGTNTSGELVAAAEHEASHAEHRQVHREATRRFQLLEDDLGVKAATAGAATSGRAKLTAVQQIERAEVVRLWRSVADQGFAEAQFALGFVTGSGIGVDQDHAEAMKWY